MNHRSQAKSVVVYGPPNCGKTQLAKELAKHYGLDRIVEAESLCEQMVQKARVGTLFLTNVRPPSATPEERRVVDFYDAIRAAGLVNHPLLPRYAFNPPRTNTGD